MESLQEIERKAIETKNFGLWKANAAMRLHIAIGTLLDAMEGEEVDLNAFAARDDVKALGQAEADTSYCVFGVPVIVNIGMIDGNLIVDIREEGPGIVGAWFDHKAAMSLFPGRRWNEN